MFILNPFKPLVSKVNDTGYSYNYTQQDAAPFAALPSLCSIPCPPPTHPMRADRLRRMDVHSGHIQPRERHPLVCKLEPSALCICGSNAAQLRAHPASVLNDGRDPTSKQANTLFATGAPAPPWPSAGRGQAPMQKPLIYLQSC